MFLYWWGLWKFNFTNVARWPIRDYLKSLSIITDSPAHCNVPLDSDSQGHVDGGAEGDSRHGVEDVDIELGENDGVGEHLIDNTEVA